MKSELRSSVPPPSAQFVFLCGGASGKSAKRRRWRKKRAGFEEVPRLATTTVDGNRLARRWAIADPYAQRNDFHKNVIVRSAATWQSVPFMWCRAGEYGLPHQCAHWFAMTRGFESAVRGGSEVRAPRPTEAGRGGAMRAGRRGRRPLRMFCSFSVGRHPCVPPYRCFSAKKEGAAFRTPVVRTPPRRRPRYTFPRTFAALR